MAYTKKQNGHWFPDIRGNRETDFRLAPNFHNPNLPPKTRQGVTFEISNGSVNRPEREMDDNALPGVTHAPIALK